MSRTSSAAARSIRVFSAGSCQSSGAANSDVGTVSVRKYANRDRIDSSTTSACLAVPAVAASTVGLPISRSLSSTWKNEVNSPLAPAL
jgi:hypothetical protein